MMTKVYLASARIWAVLAVLAVLADPTAAADMDSPDGAACWSSPTAIFLSELQVALTPGSDPLVEERKYELCPDTVYRVAFIPGVAPNVSAPVQFPFFVILPNLHLYCERNCTVELAIAQTPAVIVPTSALAGGTGLLPPGVRPVGDNLTVDGFTFRNPNGDIYDDAVGIVTLQVLNIDLLPTDLFATAINSCFQ